MLNALTKKLNGKGADVAALAEALASLGRDTEAGRRELSELKVRRHQALLDDASDTALDALERQIARAEVKVEKLSAAEPGLRERLVTVQAAARQRQLEKLKHDHRAAALAFLESARATAATHAALVAIAEQARAGGFERELAMLAVPPTVGGNVLAAPDLLDLFEAALDGPAKAPVRSAATPTTGARPRPPVLARMTDSQRGVSLALDGPARSPRPVAPDDLEPLAAGETRVVVVRPGFTTPAGSTCRAGQKIRLARDLAVSAVRAGAVEILEEAPAAPAASTLEASP